MDDVIAGGLAVIIGLIVTLAGYVALRVVLSLVGAVLGFVLAGGAVAAATGQGFLATAATWIAAVLGAVLLGWLAYAFYEVAVLLSLAAIGFSLGAGVAATLGVNPGWLVWVIGALLAVVLVWIGIAGNMPALLLVLLTATWGASLTVTGLMLLTGVVGAEELHQVGDEVVIDHGWWWTVGFAVLAVIGIVVQLRALARTRAANAFAQWSRSSPMPPRSGSRA